MAGWDPQQDTDLEDTMTSMRSLDLSNLSSLSSTLSSNPGCHFHGSMRSVGFQLGDYEVDLLNELGKGAFGTVYKGTHKRGQTIAVKKIKVQGAEEISDVLTEIKNFQNIKPHRNLVQMYDFHYINNAFWLVMEFCDLGDMQKYFKDNNPDFVTKVKFMHQSASAIRHMHEQKPPVIHRDIKPANIMLRLQKGEPVVKVTDFGLAKIIDFESDVTKTILLETQAGTPGFMAPEFFAHERYTKSVDIFALGLVYLAMIRYQHPQKDLIPLVENATRVCAVGQEMYDAFRNQSPQPTIVSIHTGDGDHIKEVKRLVRGMTQYNYKNRASVAEAEEKLGRIIQVNDTTKVSSENEVGIHTKRDDSLHAAEQNEPMEELHARTWKDGETGLGYQLVKEAAVERKKRLGGGGAFEIPEDKPLIEILESVVDPDRIVEYDTDYDIDEFQTGDQVVIDSNVQKVKTLQESLFGGWTEKMKPYLGLKGVVQQKTSFYLKVLFPDGKQWMFHPALTTKQVKVVRQIPDVSRRGAEGGATPRMSKSFSMNRFRRGDVVRLPDECKLLDAKGDEELFSKRAMVSKTDQKTNSVQIEFVTGDSWALNPDMLVHEDLSGHVIEDGDMVMVCAEKEQFMKLQERFGGWKQPMEELMGKGGVVKSLHSDGSARVEFGKEQTWTINIQALRLIFKAEDLMFRIVRS